MQTNKIQTPHKDNLLEQKSETSDEFEILNDSDELSDNNKQHSHISDQQYSNEQVDSDHQNHSKSLQQQRGSYVLQDCERGISFLAEFVHYVVHCRVSKKTQPQLRHMQSNPLRKNFKSGNDLVELVNQQFDHTHQKDADSSSSHTENSFNLTYLQILKRLQQRQSSESSADPSSRLKSSIQLSSFVSIYVYIAHTSDGSMVLAEVWKFEIVQCMNGSDSQSNSSHKGSISASPVASNQILQIEENYFKVVPDDVRKSQAEKFKLKLNSLAESLPLLLILKNQSDLKVEYRWDQIKDWREGTKINVSPQISNDLFEIGKVYAQLHYISDSEIRTHLSKDLKDVIVGQSTQQASYVSSLFGGIAGSIQKCKTIGRDRLYSDIAPQIENRSHKIHFKEEMKTEVYQNSGNMKTLEEKLRLNLQTVVDASHTKLVKKESEDSQQQIPGSVRSSYSGYGIFGKLADGIQSMLGSGKNSARNSMIGSKPVLTPASTQVADPQAVNTSLLPQTIFSQSPKSNTAAIQPRQRLYSINVLQQTGNQNESVESNPYERAQTLNEFINRQQDYFQRPRSNTFNDINQSVVAAASLPNSSSFNDNIFVSQNSISQLQQSQQQAKFIADTVVRELSQSSFDSIEILPDTPPEEDKEREELGTEKFVLNTDQVLGRSINLLEKQPQVKRLTESTKQSDYSHESSLVKFKFTLGVYLKKTKKVTMAVKNEELKVSESFLRISGETAIEDYQIEMKKEFHKVLGVQRALKRVAADEVTKF